MRHHQNSIKSKLYAACAELGARATPEQIAAHVGPVERFVDGRLVSAICSRAYVLIARREWLNDTKEIRRRCDSCKAWKRLQAPGYPGRSNPLGVCTLMPPTYVGPHRMNVDGSERPGFIYENWVRPVTHQSDICQQYEQRAGGDPS